MVTVFERVEGQMLDIHICARERAGELLEALCRQPLATHTFQALLQMEDGAWRVARSWRVYADLLRDQGRSLIAASES